MVIYGKIGAREFYALDDPRPDGTQPGWAVMADFPPGTSTHAYTYYEYRAQADGTWLEFKMLAPAKNLVWYDGKMRADNGNGTYDEVLPSAIRTKRRFQLTVQLGANSAATVDLTPYGFTAVPSFYQALTKNATGQTLYPKFGAATTTSLAVTGERSRATLLLNNGPFEPAAAGDSVTFWVHEN